MIRSRSSERILEDQDGDGRVQLNSMPASPVAQQHMQVLAGRLISKISFLFLGLETCKASQWNFNHSTALARRHASQPATCSFHHAYMLGQVHRSFNSEL